MTGVRHSERLRAGAGPAASAHGQLAHARQAWHELVEEVAAIVAPEPEHGEEQVFASVRAGVRWTLTRTPVPAGADATRLSAREREIARMIAKGYTSMTIAAVLTISAWTVDTYVRRIFAKLEVNSRSSMVAKLTREGLLGDVPAPDWPEAWREAAVPERPPLDVSHEPVTGAGVRAAR